MITLAEAAKKGFALSDQEINKLLTVLTRKFPDAIRETNAIRDVESRLHAAGECSSVSGDVGCPLKAGSYSPEFSRALQGGILAQRRTIVWPDYKDPAIKSSMFRPAPSMSAETKEKLRAIAPKRDVNDEIAMQLRECANLDEVYAVGAKYLCEKEPVLRKKYAHLNPGQQRMVIGNRMRAKYKKEHA